MIYYFLLFYKHRRTFLWLKNQQNLDLQTREVLVLFFSFCASCLLDLINSIATTQKCSCVNSCSISLALDLSGGYLTSFVFALAHTKSIHSNKKDVFASFFVEQKFLILTKQLYNRKILQILLTTSLLFDNITKHQIWGYGSVG